MEQSFNLDLQTLLANLGRRSALLRATLPKKFAHPGTAFIKVVNGQVVACAIEPFDSRGKKIEGEQALQLLLSWNHWLVTLEEPPVPTQKSPSLRNLSDTTIVQIRRLLTLQELESWSEKDRSIIYLILNAIDGRKTIQQIKAEVQLPPSIVDAVLAQLRSLHIL